MADTDAMEVDNDKKPKTDNVPTEEAKKNPKKRKKSKFFRTRAHRNPMSNATFEYPVNPQEMNWSSHYPALVKADEPYGVAKVPTIADIGCGYGGLLESLSPLFPDELILGLEIRSKVVEYVEERIADLQEGQPGSYLNISVLESNAMKYLPNYFAKGQLSKIFFLFPDPHFHKSDYRKRIINTPLLAEYAYALKKGGLLYTATDVKDLYDWEVAHLDAHPLFERIPEEIASADPVIDKILNSTDEGKKVEKAKGSKWFAVYKRV